MVKEGEGGEKLEGIEKFEEKFEEVISFEGDVKLEEVKI